MKISRKLKIGEFAAWVAAFLRQKGIETVLTGGAVVSIYTHNRYQSRDLDFISPDDHREITKALVEAGFRKKGREFAHPDTDFFVEFPTGPLAIGSQPIKAEGELTIKGKRLVLLSPTQSVMDRLAAFFYWTDRQALDQAQWIAEEHPIKIDKVRLWAKKEGEDDKFNEFLELVQRSKKRKKRKRS